MSPALSRLLVLLLAAGLFPAVSPANAQGAHVLSVGVKGPPVDSVPGVDEVVEEFRDLLGDDNGTDPPGLVGRREVTWDEVADHDASPAHLPGDHFNTTIPKGLVLDGGDPALTGSAGYMVSATSPAVPVDQTEFGNLNITYRSAFAPYAEQGNGRIFAALGGTTLEVRFRVPGTDQPAAVRGFGAVFVDVDFGSATRLEAFTADGTPLESLTVPSATGNEGLSFAGVAYDAPLIASVRLTLGNDAIEAHGSPNDAGQLGPGDVVALDNLLFGEPTALPVEDDPTPEPNPFEATVAERAESGDPEAVRSAIAEEVSGFVTAVGGPDNGGLAGTQASGRRDVTWDDVPDPEHHPSAFPGDYHHRVAPRGLRVTTDTVGASSATLAAAVAEDVLAPPLGLAQATDTPTAMISQTPDGVVAVAEHGHVLELTFTVPGSNTPGAVDAVAFVLSDVDTAGATTIDLYDVDGAHVDQRVVPAAPGTASLSFVSARFAVPIVHRAVVTLGDGPLTSLGQTDVSEGGPDDVVALDRVVYSEPHLVLDTPLIGLEDSGTSLHRFNTLDAMAATEIALAGLDGDRLVALDRDQTTGTVYGLGAAGGLYCVDDGGTTQLVRELEVPLQGSRFALDFDAVARRLITVSDTGQHLSINRFEGSTEELEALTRATGDGLAEEPISVTALALGEDGTGWALDDGTLVAYEGGRLSTIGALNTVLPANATLERTADGTLWTVTDAAGPGLSRLDTASGAAQRVSALPEPMIGIIDDDEFGPCPPNPVAVSSEVGIVGPRVTWLLDVVNDHDDDPQATTLTAPLPQGVAVAGPIESGDTPSPCAVAEAAIECDLGTLSPGDEAHLAVPLRITDPAMEELVLTASVSADGEVADHTSATLEVPPGGFALPTGTFGDDDIVATAVEVSRLRFDTAAEDASGGRYAQHVVVSRLDGFADSLAGSALTGTGPLLFAETDLLPVATAEEVQRVLAPGGRVYLLGGTAAIGTAVEAALAADGYEVVRLAGQTRIETALAVAAEVRQVLGDSGEVVLARGFGPEDNPTAAWADSVTAGGYAAWAGTPVLLTPTVGLHTAVGEVLDSTSGRTVLLGGTAALSAEVEEAIALRQRVAGPNRAATAVAIAEELWGQQPVGERRYLVINAGVEDGWAFGLAAAGLAADARAPLLTVVGDAVPPETEGAVDSCYDVPVDLLALGGSRVSTEQRLALDQLDTGIC